ncbi:MAG: hypothetical protein K6E54_01950, partial [Bacteroidaceae bacterium]|nr:hypothetical protein [Bacteroidaceae bacterium]
TTEQIEDTDITVQEVKEIINVTPADFTVIDGAIVRADKTKSQTFAIPKYTQSELYDHVINGLTKIYTKINKITTRVENESIELKTSGNEMTTIDLEVIAPQRIDGEFTILFKFKNGEIIVESPTVSKFKSSGFSKAMATLSLKEIGRLDPKGVKGFGTFINNKIDKILNASFND